MRAARTAALCLTCLVLLSGCTSGSREPDELTVVRLAAADSDGKTVTVTAFPAPLEGGEEKEEGQETHTGKGADPAEACLMLASDGGSFAFLGHTEHILVGDAMAERGTKALLECAVLGDSMRPDAYLWLVEGDTAAAWGQAAGGDGGAKKLSAYCTDSGTRRKVMAWTAAQSLNRLLRTGVAPVPVLPAGGGEPEGYALLTEEGVAGILKNEGAEGLELLLGQTCHHTLKAGEIVLEVVSVSTEVEPVWSKGTFYGVEVTCRLTARRANGSNWAEKNVADAENELKQWAEARLNAVWEKLKAWNVDGGELRHRALAASAWQTEKLKADWPDELSRLQIAFSVETHIDF